MWSDLVISLALVGAYADGDIPIDVDYDDDLIGLDSEMPGVCGPERWKTQGRVGPVWGVFLRHSPSHSVTFR